LHAARTEGGGGAGAGPFVGGDGWFPAEQSNGRLSIRNTEEGACRATFCSLQTASQGAGWSGDD
jgi:hypothetical protein